MRIGVGILPLGLLLAQGCGGDDAGGAPPDASPLPDALCPLPQGRAFVLEHLALLPSDQGLDLDGDGAVDNELGNLPESARTSVNAGLANDFARGSFLAAMFLSDWEEPPSGDDPDVALHILHIYDADRPADPTNNYTGDGAFIVHQDAFDLSCGSATRADETRLVDSVLTARRSRWAFELNSGTGQLEFADARARGTFDPTLTRLAGHWGAIMPLCSLAALPIPGELSGTVLDAIANDPALASAVALDVDRDGDGFEQVVGDGVSVAYCLDGDGARIDGADCPCHPAIVDGYTVGLELEVVLARLVGVI